LPAYFLLIILLLVVSPASAWNPHLIGDTYAPETLLVVDKENQNFLIFSNKSPLNQEHSWQCTTGQAYGDKAVEGDLKTPEGVYFLERRISGENLPFDLYGELAFTLNYPNPIDRINQKTGHSIWVHGRGKEVVPYDTEGCVAMEMKYMLALETMIDLGKTPVIITESFSWEPAEASSENSRKIAEQTIQWANDWKSKSERYFEHYDPVLYSKSSGQSFDSFMAHKVRLFDQYLWMDVYIENPKVLKGPDYWVSYFGQVFNAPGFYSVGIKRLYWKTIEPGEFRIVGEEWLAYPKDYLQQNYLGIREMELRQVIRQWRQAWLDADIRGYKSFYHQDAVQNQSIGINNIVEYKKDIWDRGLLPEAIDFEDIKISSHDYGFRADFNQRYSNVNGYSDYSLKTLVLAPFGDDWLITSETWSEIR
jgi:murein L,D-transpeptidase YafK